MTRKSGTTTFSFGVAAGSVGGFILGVALGKYVFSLASVALASILRRDPSDKQRPKFEWLLQ